MKFLGFQAETLLDVLVVIEESIEKCLSRQKKVVTLPLKSVDVVVSNLCPLLPLGKVLDVLIDNTHLAVKQTDTAFNGDCITSRCVVTADKIRGFSTCYLHSGIANVVFPYLACAFKGDITFGRSPCMSSIVKNLFFIEDLLPAEPCFINKVVLGIAHP